MRFRVLRVSDANLDVFASADPTLQVCNGGESLARMGDFIGSGFQHHTFRSRSRRLSKTAKMKLRD